MTKQAMTKIAQATTWGFASPLMCPACIALAHKYDLLA